MPTHTPWKKNRKLGDIYGGRERLKFSDNVFKRAHSLERPGPDDVLPILIEDNPSRDFFFPLNGKETLEALSALPKRDFEGITHVWLRRLKKSDYIHGNQPYAWFSCGSGVRLITVFPWPNDMIVNYGVKRPPNRIINEVERYGATVEKSGKRWFSRWNLEAVRRFYIQGILYHEVGHHIDWYNRHWSDANLKPVEEYADQYAIAKTATATHLYNKLEKQL